MYSRKSNFLKFFVIFVVILSVTLVNTSADQDVSTSNNPRVYYPETSFDFGTVPQGEKLIHNFNVVNQGKSDLVIRKVSAACGCTAAVAENALLRPQESTVVRVTFDTSGFVNEKVKTIRVYTNDPLNSSQLLEVRAHIQSEFVANPKRIDFRDVTQGTVKEEIISITNNFNTNFGAEDAFTKSANFNVTFDKTKQQVSVRSSVDAPIGIHHGVLTVKTASPSQSIISIPLFLEVVGKVAFKPEIVQFGIMSPKHGEVTKIIRVINKSGNPTLKVSNVASDIKDLVVYDVTNSETGEINIFAKYSPKLPAIVRGMLTINFHDDPIDYQVPVFGVIDEDNN